MARANKLLPTYDAQLPKTGAHPPSGRAWVHELGYEGQRVGCAIEGTRVRLENRHAEDCTRSYPEIVRAVRQLPVKRALLDGVVTVVLPDGTTSGEALHRGPESASGERLAYFVFDLLHVDGEDLTNLPLAERKRACERLLCDLPRDGVLRYSVHFDVDGPTLLRRACELGARCIVSKRRDSPYRAGLSAAWQETCCEEVERHGTAKSSILGVTITTPERPVYPRLGFDKLALARFHADVAAHLLPYIANRPLTLVRCEKGVRSDLALRAECKFLRHAPGWHRWAKPPIRRIEIQEQKKVGEYLVVDSPEGLVALAQGDILEIHVWNSTTEHLEKPDRLVFDLDPGPDVGFAGVIEAAVLLRDELVRRGLRSWPKLTGGKGLHVVVPFRPENDWAHVYAESRAIAEALVRQAPEALTLAFAKGGRERKILVDYKRNHRAAVAVAAYSPRAHPAGAVSAPVDWDELVPGIAPDAYTVRNVRERLEGHEPWRDFWRARQRLRARQ